MAAPDIFEFTWTRFAFAAVNFLLLVAILYKLLHKPLLRVLEERGIKIEASFREAEDKARQADAVRGEYEGRLEAIEEERDHMLTEARERAEKARQETVEKARAEAAREVANLKRDWERQRRDAVSVMESDIVDAALALAARVLEELTDADVEARLHQRLLAQLGEMRGTGLTIASGPVRVVSAAPLDEESRAALEQSIRAACEGAAEVAFDVDAALVAGARVEFSSQAVDASLADAVAAVRERFDRISPEPAAEGQA